MIYKYFFQIYDLSLNFLHSIFWSTYIFNAIQLIFFFPFIICAFVVVSKKSFCNLMSCFKSFKFMSVIYFELIFVWCEVKVHIHLFAYGYLVASAAFFEKTFSKQFLFPELFWHLCRKSIGHKCKGVSGYLL